MTDEGSASAAAVALRGTIWTIGFRVLSFVGTQVCYRKLNAQTLGQTQVQLDLLLNMTLFLSREGFRLTVVKKNTTTEKNEQNQDVSWWTIPSTIVVAFLALLWHIRRCLDSDLSIDFYYGGILYCFAACIEGFAEPCVLYFLRHLRVSEKASAEGTASFVKTMVTVLLLNSMNTYFTSIVAMGLAQCAYAFTYSSILIYRYITTRQKNEENNNTTMISLYWHTPTMIMVGLFTLQGMFKFGLTEGDRIVMTLLADSYNQGVYALGSGYGGLAARMIFQPMEETARLLFGRFVTDITETNKEETNGNSSEKNNGADTTVEMLYTSLIKAVLYVGFVFSCLAVNYTYILLNILAGQKWGSNEEAVNVLSAFCVYTAFLACNGMTEAFVYGVAASAGDIGKLGMAHTITGVLFALSAPIAVAQFGTVGLVAANCASMLGRSLFSVHFAAHYMATRNDKTVPYMIARLLRQMFPVLPVMVAFIASFFVTKVSLNRTLAQIQVNSIESASLPWFRVALQHISVGATCGIGILSMAYTLERDFQRNIRKIWKKKSD